MSKESTTCGSFKKMTVSTKIIFSIMFLLLILLILGSSSYLFYNQLSSRSNILIKEKFPVLLAISNIQSSMLQIKVSERTLINSNIPWDERVKQYKILVDSTEELNGYFATINKSKFSTEEEKDWKIFIDLISQSKTIFNEFKALALKRDEYLSGGYSNTDQEVIDIESKMMMVLMAKRTTTEQAEAIINKTILNISTTVDKIAQENEKAATSNMATLLMTLASSLLVSFLMAIIIPRNINRDLRKVTSSIQNSSDQIAQTATELFHSSEKLSESVTNQASSTEESSSSLEEINGMTVSNLSNTEEVQRISSDILSISQESNKSMKELLESMSMILDSNKKLEGLVSIIKSIGDKTTLIDEIVFQTKLLSFNASVEAERAGDAGRGFAVVAQEVGNLAKMSGNSAADISTIVKESIKKTEEITLDNKKRVDDGNIILQKTATLLESTILKVQEASNATKQVSIASKEQALGIKQIATVFDQLRETTIENSSVAEKTKNSSIALSEYVKTLENCIINLDKMIG